MHVIALRCSAVDTAERGAALTQHADLGAIAAARDPVCCDTRALRATV
jgi:hypothetical protein